MALTKKIEELLKTLFKKQRQILSNSTGVNQGLLNYINHRNMICSKVMENTKDLMQAKTRELSCKHGVREEDTVSIIHDSIIKAVDNFDETKNVKFTTYLFSIISNILKNHLKHISSKGRTSFYNEAAYQDYKKHNLEDIVFEHKKRNVEFVNTLTDGVDSVYVDQSGAEIDVKFCVDHILNNVKTHKEKLVILGLLRGETPLQIAKKIKTTRTYAYKLIKKLQKQFNYIEKELWQIRNLY